MVVFKVLPDLGKGAVTDLGSTNLRVQLKVKGQRKYGEEKPVREDANRPNFSSDFWQGKHS
jgi:hypothetical protein